jgi:hypothetical protein
MTLAEFCTNLTKLHVSQSQQAIAILWHHDEKQNDIVMSSGQLAKILHESGLGVPHSTRLGKDIQKSGLVLTNAHGFRLKALSRATIREWVTPILVSETVTSPVSKGLVSLSARVIDPAERGFIAEAIICIDHEAARAAIVLGWCAAIHRMRKKIETLGFPSFNSASARLKSQISGKYKRYNKEFTITSFGELQTMVFDTDLIIVLEGMGLIDGTQAQRLETCFEYRCHSAHPGDAPIGDPHVVAFFHDIVEMVLANPRFS